MRKADLISGNKHQGQEVKSAVEGWKTEETRVDDGRGEERKSDE